MPEDFYCVALLGAELQMLILLYIAWKHFEIIKVHGKMKLVTGNLLL